MSKKSILGAFAVIGAAAMLASCSFSEKSNWYLIDSGYSVDTARESGEFAFRVHLNELKQLGGDVKSAQFELFVSERLKRHGVCPRGWELLPCSADGSCVHRTHSSVTVIGRCLAP